MAVLHLLCKIKQNDICYGFETLAKERNLNRKNYQAIYNPITQS